MSSTLCLSVLHQAQPLSLEELLAKKKAEEEAEAKVEGAHSAVLHKPTFLVLHLTHDP